MSNEGPEGIKGGFETLSSKGHVWILSPPVPQAIKLVRPCVYQPWDIIPIWEIQRALHGWCKA